MIGALASATAGCAGCARPPPFPAESTPEGAYARIALAVAEDRVVDVFAYLEDEAQWACHTIAKERRTALERAKSSFPAAELAVLENEIATDANAEDGRAVFERLARTRGFPNRLRRDLSGVLRVETDGDRATVVTARATRYPFRRRPVGIWGLTIFTAELAADAEKATRDRGRVEEAARDWDLSKARDAGAH